MSALVIGLGQAAAGDDAVGFAVLDHIRQMGPPAGTELAEAKEATALIELLQTVRRVVLVDAIVGHPRVGDVLELPEEALAAGRPGPRPLSTHGVAVGQAIELARVVASGAVSRDISLVGVAIAPPQRYTCGLSPVVQAAVPVAARVVLGRLGG
jgi:hydrogenase maturation protease